MEQPQSFTCPYCGKMGFTETSLQDHVTSEHAETSTEVVSVVPSRSGASREWGGGRSHGRHVPKMLGRKLSSLVSSPLQLDEVGLLSSP